MESDVMPDAILKQQQLERLSAMKAQGVDVNHSLHSLRQFNIHSRVVNKDPRIHKIRLPLNLTAPQTRQQAIRLDQPDARLRQANSVSYPERKLPAHKIRSVEDRIEAGGASVNRIAVTLRPEERAFEAKVVAVDRRLHRRHVGSHLHS